MSATHLSRKRKLEAGQTRKGVRPPSKKSRRYTYHSDSEDDEPEVTARDAPTGNVNSATVATTEISTVDGKGKSQQSNKAKKHDANTEPLGTRIKEHNNAHTSNEKGSDAGGLDSADTTGSDASDDDSDNSEDSQAESTTRTKTKRHDPSAFATSISAILGSSLSRNKRVDPVLSRSKDAAEVSKALAESKLDVKARKQLVAERRLAKEKGRVRDVLIGDRKSTIEEGYEDSTQTTGMSAAEILAKEKQLRKLAQRGVVKLFNAVRAAQVKGEEEARKVKTDGVIGMDNREDKVKNMSKNAFLDLVGAGGKGR